MAIRQGMTDRWTKSSHSAGNGACVEVRSTEPRAVAVRDSKVPQGPSLDFVPGSWTAFVGSLGQGSLARR